MRTGLIAGAVLGTLAVTLAAVAVAGPVAAKQRVAIQEKAGAFVLTPLAPGVIKRDTGTGSFCCWTDRHIVRDGQAIEVNDPEITLTFRRGTLVIRSTIGFIDLPNGWSVFTGTWRVTRGTGDYAGLAGGGRRAGVMLPGGGVTSQFDGFLGAR